MPFLTEELWQHLNGWPSRDASLEKNRQGLIMAAWPQSGPEDEETERDFTLLIDIIREIRNARAEAVRDAPENIKKDMTGRRIEASIAGGSRTAMLRREAETIARLARLDPNKFHIEKSLSAEHRPERAVTLVVGGVEVVLPLAGLVDVDSERERLQSEADNARAEIERTDKLLANEQFVSRAKPEVVQREREKLDAARDRLAKLEERLHAL
jgi:valyl-tRNA synthetase